MKSADLTILLRAVDKTKGAFDKVEKRLGKLGKLGKIAGAALASIATSAAAAFSAAAFNGQELFTQLDRMRVVLGTTTREAEALFLSVQEFNPGVGIEQLQEALITLEEGFFDAHAESGPLFDLVKDFGVNIDLGVEGAKNQLLEFLKALKQIPSEADRVGAVVSNLGGEDAKALLPLVRNVEDLDRLMVRLKGSIEDVPGITSQLDIDGVDEYTTSTKELNVAWDTLSKTIFTIVDGPLTSLNRLLIIITDGVNSLFETISFGDITTLDDGIDASVQSWADRINQRFTEGILNPIRLKLDLDPIATQVNGGLGGAASIASINNFSGSSGGQISTNESLVSGQDKVTEAIKKTNVAKKTELELATASAIQFRESITSQQDLIDLQLLKDIDSANDGGFNINQPEFQSPEDMRIERLQKEQQAYNDITASIDNMGSALQSLGEASGRGSSKAFKNFQRLQIAISTAAAISAAIQTLSDPTLGFFGKIAAYTKIAAIGFGAIAQLKSINVGSSGASAPSASGGSTGGAQGGPLGTTQQSQQQSQVTKNIEVNIPGGFIGDLVQSILEPIVDEINDNDNVRINSNRIAA